MANQQRITFDPFSLDLVNECVWRGDQAIPLRPKAFAVLRHLVEHHGELVTKEQLLEAVWPETFVGDAVLKVTIRQLRAALDDDPSEPRFIETAHRRGYRFIATITADTSAAAEQPPAPRPATNLPHALTTFVGRERQIGEVREWLAKSRLVTLVGPGGIGKTRLAIEAARGVVGDFPDGVWLVELAPLSESALITHTIAAAIRTGGARGSGEMGSVEAWLADKRALLVLDNCEHLVEACAHLAERLLETAPELRILATSQESLAIAGEVAWPVSALAVPSDAARAGGDSEAVRLFVDRATLANPGFAVADDAAPLIAELCRRLEGIPLAIELAAARVKALTIEQILERLQDRFRLLAGGSRSAPTRQQTLRAALDWSYELLTAEERAVLDRLSVFAGGWTLEEAEAVAGLSGGGPGVVLDALARLVDKSLVVLGGGPHPRYRMLEVVRSYAFERLDAAGAAVETAARHAEVFLGLITATTASLLGPHEAELLARLEREHDNIRAALAHLLVHDPIQGLTMAAALLDFWSIRGHFREGKRWIEAGLDRCPDAPKALRMMALRAVGEFAWRKGELAPAREHLEQSMRLARELSDKLQIAWSGFHLALVLQQQSDIAGSVVLLEESLELAREVGKARLVGNALNSLGEAARIEGRWARARELYEQSLEIHREVGHPSGFSVTLNNLGAALAETGDLAGACVCYRDALASLRELGNCMGASLVLDGLGAVAARRREWKRAARLAGAADALRTEVGGELEPADRQLRDRYLEVVRERLGNAALERALAEGRATDRNETLEDALRLCDETRSRSR